MLPHKRAKRAAARRDRSLRTSGRLRVRVISASYWGSKSILSVFAQAQDKNVPVVRKRSVKVDVDSVVPEFTEEVADERISGMGYREYADVVVRRTRNDRRGFVNERYVASLRRRMAEAGREVAAVVSRDDASKGRDVSCGAELFDSSPSLFGRRLRCGRT